MTYEIHNLLRASLYNGEKDKWNELCSRQNVEVWKNDILLKMIQEQGKQKYYSESHLQLLKYILQNNILPPQSYIEYQKSKQWITTFIDKKYPWFICNSWNHLSPNYIYHLYEESLYNFHMENLYELCNNMLIENLWISDFWLNAYHVKKFVHKIKKKNDICFIKENLRYFPFENIEKTIIFGEEIIGNSSLFKVFIYNSNLDNIFFLKIIIKKHNVSLLKWFIKNKSIHLAKRNCFNLLYKISKL